METDGGFYFLGTSLKVFFIDLLLSGDNAIVIALACRSLAPHHMRKAVLFGTGAAILLRVGLTTIIAFLLDVPGLKLAGALALLVIAVRLMAAEGAEAKGHDIGERSAKRDDDLWAAIGVIFIADLVLSLDNVVALAAAAQGSIFFLAFGLLASIPLLMYGSMFIMALLDRYPVLIAAGGALLGWIAGDIGISDPVISGWVGTHAPALTIAMPLLGAVFVLLESRIAEQERGMSTAPEARRIIDPSVFVDARLVRQDEPTAELVRPDAPVADANPAAEPPRQSSLVMALLGLAKRALTQDASTNRAAPTPLRVGSPAIEDGLVGRTRALVAGGNLGDQQKLSRALDRLGCAVDVADDGSQTLDRLGHGQYGLLVLDPDMPQFDVFELTARVRAEEQETGRHTPIIAFVGHRTGGDRDQPYIAAGMDGCLSRRVVFGDVEEIVSIWLQAGSPLHRQPSPVEPG
jgi:YjbE family integral membrane protein